MAGKGKQQPVGQGQTSAGVICPDSGCRKASSTTEATGAKTATDKPTAKAASGKTTDGKVTDKATGKSTATCQAGAACQAVTSGGSTTDYVQLDASCAGTGCATHTEGNAEARSPDGHNWASSRTDCTAGGDGQCAGESTVGANAVQGAQASAACAASEGTHCSYGAQSHGRAAGVKADSVGHKDNSSGGQVMTSAAAVGDKSSAQAMASCVGTEGTDCHYSYDALRTASARDPSTGSWADARAHGHKAGKMGGGAVAVSAVASAKGNQAFAAATCTGQADCSDSHFTAEAHDKARGGVAPTWTTPGGYNDATKWGRCSGTTGSCGVTAQAIPGQSNGGNANCTGDCGNFTQGGHNSFTATVPSLKAQAEAAAAAAAANSKPIPIEKLGPDQRGVEGSIDDHGNKILKVKPQGGKVQTCTVGKDCQGANHDSLSTSGGETVNYGDNTFNGNVPVTPGSDKHDDIHGSKGITSYRDSNGNGAYSVKGDGEVTDGVSGSHITYRNSKPVPSITNPKEAPDSDNHGHYSNLKGSPFATTCAGGCVGDLKSPDIGKGRWTDHIDLQDSPGVSLIGRDGVGNAATLSFNGAGTVTTDEKDIIKANGDGTNTAGDMTYVKTRDAFGHSGVFDVTGDQTGSIKLTKENYTLVKKKGANGLPGLLESLAPGSSADLKVTTPDGNGQNGWLHCVGACELTRPNGMKDFNPNGLSEKELAKPGANRTCANCIVDEPIAKLGEKPSKTGGITNLADGTVHFTDPYGNTHQCDGKQCHIGMIYGPGGGVTCSGKGCSGTNTEGQYMKGEGWFLYPTTDGKGHITGNQGIGCRAGAGDKCDTNVPTEYQLRWQGDPDPSWTIITDPSYKRPSLGNDLDKQIAQRLGVDPNGPLPALTKSDIAGLSKEDRDKYNKQLPPLTQEQKDEAILASGSEQSTQQRLLGKLEGQQSGPELEHTIDLIKKANQGGLSDTERKQLAPQLKKLEDASDTGKELADAYKFVNGIDRASYDPPTTIADINAKLASKPALVNELAGDAPVTYSNGPQSLDQLLNPSANPPKPQKVDPTDQAMANMLDTPENKLKRARDKAAQMFGIDPNADPNAPPKPMTPEQTKQAANEIADLSLIPRERAHDQQNTELEKRRNTLDQSDPAQVDAYNADVKKANAETKAINDIKKRINDNTPAPGSDAAQQAQQRRDLDLAWAKNADDPAFYQRLNSANTDLKAVTDLHDQMAGSGDPNQVAVAKTLKDFEDASLTRYNVIATGPRSQGNMLGSGEWVTIQGDNGPEQRRVWMNLPSTGRPDVAYALNAAVRLPTFKQDLQVFGDKSLLATKNKDGKEVSVWDSLSADDKANIAAYHTAAQWEGPQLNTKDKIEELKTGIKDCRPGHDRCAPGEDGIRNEADARKRDDKFKSWFSDSRSHPDGWDQWTHYLNGAESKKAEDAFNDGKPNVVMFVLGKIGDGIMAAHNYLRYDMPSWTYIGGKPPDRNSLDSKISDGLAKVIAYAPKGIGHLVGALGVQLYNDAKYDPDSGWAKEPDRLSGETWAEYQERVYPFTGMFFKAGQDTWNRWKPTFSGNWDVVKHGNWHQGLYSGYSEDPVGTFMADLTVPTLVLYGAGLVLKVAGAAAKAGTLGSLGVRAAGGLNRISKVAMAPMQVVAAPYQLWGAVGRLGAFGMSKALPTMGDLAMSGGTRMMGYASDVANMPAAAGALWATGRVMNGAGQLARASAPYFGVVARNGLMGLLRGGQASSPLTPDQLGPQHACTVCVRSRLANDPSLRRDATP
ncbi:MAG: hypothetical protein J2P32_01855, partial [Actinobacteria bacterium]|nr:hypothetical protein [Actinomycetota bacterium]